MFGVFFIVENMKIEDLDKIMGSDTEWKLFGAGEDHEEEKALFIRLYGENALKRGEMKIAVKSGRRMRVIPLREISRITKEERKLHIYWGSDKVDFYGTIGLIGEKLEDFDFVRVNSYCLISLNHIRTAGLNKVELLDGTTVTVGRKYAEHYRMKIEKIRAVRIN